MVKQAREACHVLGSGDRRRCDSMKILAAIVTYNRAALLDRCIDGVLAQTRAADELVVIDNSSTDGTADLLLERGVTTVTQPNCGGAGGFHRAVQYALDEGYDHVWLMDDDGYPDSAALGLLANKMKPGVACASSVLLRENERSRFVFPFPKLNTHGAPTIIGWPRKYRTLAALKALYPDHIYPFAQFFNGALVSLEYVRKVGNVESKFFTFGDEIDFQMRLRREGKTLTHLDAYHFHPDVTKRPISDAKTYYYVKNTIILNHRYFNRPRLRNVLTVIMAILRAWARNGAAAGLSLAFGRKRGLMKKAIVRGLRGQIGPDFGT